jgi:hypothetical protein
MESFTKITKLATFFFVLGVSDCAFFTPVELRREAQLVLEEISPLPRTAVVKPEEPEYEPVYSVMRIIEVSEVNGVQKFFLIRAGVQNSRIREGAGGEIADDEEFKKIIGDFKIVEAYGDFFRCEAQRLDYKIGENAYVRIQIGERIKQ